MAKGKYKKQNLSEMKKYLFTILDTDRAPIAYMESHIASETGLNDTRLLRNADIIRYCIHNTYNRLSGGKSHYHASKTKT